MEPDDQLLKALCDRRDAPSDPHASAKPYPVATAEDVRRAEAALGFALPPLLKRIYLEVANGGIGPAYGLFGVENGAPTSYVRDGQTMAEAYHELRANSDWPERLIPLCDWGCANFSCLDCADDDGPVITSCGLTLADPGFTLQTWLQAWLDGVSLFHEMFHPGPTKQGINPFTKEPMIFHGQGQPKGRILPAVNWRA